MKSSLVVPLYADCAYTRVMKAPKINIDPIRSSLVSAAGTLMRVRKSHDEVLGELFEDVQTNRIYEDGKTFVDLVPKNRTKAIRDEYNLLKQD